MMYMYYKVPYLRLIYIKGYCLMFNCTITYIVSGLFLSEGALSQVYFYYKIYRSFINNIRCIFSDLFVCVEVLRPSQPTGLFVS